MISSVHETSADVAFEPLGFVIQLFGRLTVTCGGQPLPKMRSRKEPYLLALLALHAVDGAVEREWLAATLWPETVGSGALYNLRRSLGALRDALGAEATRIVAPSPRTLRLNLDGADCDLRRFDAALRRGDERAFSEAVALHTAPLLQGCMEEWVFEPRTTRLRAVLMALESLARTAEERGEVNVAIDHLRRILDLDPLRETALRSLMTLLVAQGNQAAATALFHTFRDRLMREADAEPAPETLQLNRKILLDTRRTHAAAREDRTTRRPGPAASDAGGNSLLPPGADLLFGRADAIDTVQALLKASRLVTLTGTGGIGKTSLAVHVSESVAAEYPDGMRFVDLSSQSDPELLEQIVATAVGVTFSSGTPAAIALADYLRSRRLLILLDNCEHILAACSQLAAKLLADCRDIRILATSREPLRLPMEATWRVPGLALVDAVALFERRATLARSTFISTPVVRASVEHICQRLDGIPLAIEMAAAWIRAMTAAQIAIRLDDAFRLLARTDGAEADHIPRHRTLRATLDWSYGLLTEQERVLLARLSIFAGGWTLEAAEAVCPIDDVLPKSAVLEVLVALVDRSLVVYREDADAVGRYVLLETTRAYATERLPEGEYSRLQTALARYLLQLAETAATFWEGPGEQHWLGILEIELPNIRVALRDPLPLDNADEPWDIRLSAALFRFWWRRAHIVEGERFLRTALNRWEPTAQTATRAAALNACGALANFRRDTDAALAFHTEALAIRRTLEDKRGIAVSLHNIGILPGDTARSVACLTECVALYRALGDDRRAESNQRYLDRSLAEGQNSLSEIIDGLMQSLDRAVQRGDRSEEAALLGDIGVFAQKDHRLALARDCLRRSLTLHMAHGDRIRIAEGLESIAVALALLGNECALPQLYGATARLRGEIACPMHEGNRDPYERNIAQARLSLGDAVFDAHWSKGQAMDMEAAVAFAMRD